jgi:hypothetical protein
LLCIFWIVRDDLVLALQLNVSVYVERDNKVYRLLDALDEFELLMQYAIQFNYHCLMQLVLF